MHAGRGTPAADAGPKKLASLKYGTPELGGQIRNQADSEEGESSREGQPSVEASQIVADVGKISKKGANTKNTGLTSGEKRRRWTQDPRWEGWRGDGGVMRVVADTGGGGGWRPARKIRPAYRDGVGVQMGGACNQQCAPPVGAR